MMCRSRYACSRRGFEELQTCAYYQGWRYSNVISMLLQQRPQPIPLPHHFKSGMLVLRYNHRGHFDIEHAQALKWARKIHKFVPIIWGKEVKNQINAFRTNAPNQLIQHVSLKVTCWWPYHLLVPPINVRVLELRVNVKRDDCARQEGGISIS